MSEAANTEKYIQGSTGPWEVVIGLEIHAQVVSKAKLFSGASAEFGADPNQQVSFVDAAFPGMLPVINEVCVDQAIRTGLGLNAKINELSVFERKNYFYPDLPQGYQISQFQHPIVGKGYLDIDLEEGTKRVKIERLHLEQDAGKSIHAQHPEKSFVDLNRAGVALMEIVTEPDMRSIEEAQAFVRKLRSLLRCLGTCDGNMEQGSMRADINVSLRRPGEPLGTRTETKNLNSVRFLGQAIQYEIQRQMEILEDGGTIDQETRLFDVAKGVTRSMRSKEEAHDYRYFPDPDLPPLVVDSDRIERIRQDLPELPDAKKARFVESFGLSPYDAAVLTAEPEVAAFYEGNLEKSRHWEGGTGSGAKQAAKIFANWIISELFSALKREDLTIEASKVSGKHLISLVDLILDSTISGRIAKEVFAEMWATGSTPEGVVKEKGLEQVSDNTAIENVINMVIKQNADKVEEYKAGKDKLFGFFVGQVMKAMGGKANPKLVNEILKKKLGS